MLGDGLAELIGPCKEVASHELLCTYHGIIHGQPAASAVGLDGAHVAPFIQGGDGILNELMGVLGPAYQLVQITVSLESSHRCTHVTAIAHVARYRHYTQPPVVPSTHYHAEHCQDADSRRRHGSDERPAGDLHVCDGIEFRDRNQQVVADLVSQ
jgi:hypothetical protein